MTGADGKSGIISAEALGTPFALPARDPVSRIRSRLGQRLPAPPGLRTQPMRGFDADYMDIVDYIVRITDRIWIDRAIGLIYDTYDHACVVHSMYGVARSVEEVIVSTIVGINVAPDGELSHLNVAWSGEEDRGFYTSHLGFGRSTNVGPSPYGPATGKRVALRFAADCISTENKIHTEWLVRDNGAFVDQLGFDRHEAARAVAAAPRTEIAVVAVPNRLDGQTPPRPLGLPDDTLEGWIRNMIHDLWNLRRLDHLAAYYAADVAVHSGGGREAAGLGELSSLIVSIMAGLPDGAARVDHICWSEETDGVIVAVRWVIVGHTRPGGFLGEAPAGQAVEMMICSHLRFGSGKIVEEWTVFDEIGVLAQAYRAVLAGAEIA